MDLKSKAIGVFDSGLGGLTAVKRIAEIMPNENIVYFGDTGRVPYGTRSEQTIIKYAKQDIAFLKSLDVKMVIAACGTVSAILPNEDSENIGLPYSGVLLPAAKRAAELTQTGRICVLGTQATVKSGAYKEAAVPGMLALIAALISIAVKEWMFHYTKRAARKINSTSLLADAWHHRSDALSSVGALLGIGLAMVGFPVADPVASIIICILIIKVAFDIFREASSRMIDTSADSATENELKKAILSVEGVIEIDLLNTRLFGPRMYVDVEISADSSLSLLQAHSIAEAVHDKLENKFPEIKHCMVHVNPYCKS